MKKLLDELEVARDNADSIKEAQAVQLCINIVRAHNPWHDVGELPRVTELPERAVVNGIEKHYSIDVIMRNEYTTRIGCYHYSECEWIYDAGLDYNPDYIPTHWAYLPEVKP